MGSPSGQVRGQMDGGDLGDPLVNSCCLECKDSVSAGGLHSAELHFLVFLFSLTLKVLAPFFMSCCTILGRTGTHILCEKPRHCAYPPVPVFAGRSGFLRVATHSRKERNERKVVSLHVLPVPPSQGPCLGHAKSMHTEHWGSGSPGARGTWPALLCPKFGRDGGQGGSLATPMLSFKRMWNLAQHVCVECTEHVQSSYAKNIFG